MTKDKALQLLHTHMTNQNLRRHCYAVGAVMKALANYFHEDADSWEIAGILHDADYEITKNDTEKHTWLAVDWAKEAGASKEITDAILAHGWKYGKKNPEPKNKMEWSLYCCDELTGLIVAVALVMPDHKLASVTVESIQKKWKQKSFAAGAHRGQIELCEEKLNIPLKDFISISLKAMQSVHQELGL